MAKLINTIFLIISSILITTTNGNQADSAWFQSICQGKEKVAKLHFYLHEQWSGKNETAFEVARASITSTSSTLFGKVMVLDDLLTAGPDINSEELGRAQGFAVSASLATMTFVVNFNFVFTSGKYNGSTLTIVGRDQLMDEERELLIVGGTGVFRFARGYVIEKTIEFNAEPKLFGYTLYVTHVGLEI